MILTVVIGNTNTRFVWFRGYRPVRSRVVPTAVVARHGKLPELSPAEAVAVASVVPEATRVVRAYLRAHAGLPSLVVGPRTQTGLRFRYRRRDLGTDRVCAAVGARHRFPNQDVIVFDFGTATTVNVILREGVFAGGAILPGIQMCLEALAAGTAVLPKLPPAPLRSPLQHNTGAAVQAGVANLFAGGIDRIIDRTEHALGRSLLVVSTGGAAGIARRYSRRIGVPRPHLAGEGLVELLQINLHPELKRP
jgi:type III pantothenate kinase